MRRFAFPTAIVALLLGGCSPTPKVDLLITSGTLFDGTDTPAKQFDVGVCGEQICYLAPSGENRVEAARTIDATGMIVSPGFIDPHTHSFEELVSSDKNANLNYLFQGVTTVVNGNDGGGPVSVEEAVNMLNPDGIGTNVALYVGHGSLRQAVLGNEDREASAEELQQMGALLAKGMQDGALGLSSGLYYVPGSFAPTSEVIALAKIAAERGGIYDTHLRDESTFNIGFLPALDEAIQIAQVSGIHLHVAHIKALGVDVWGQSKGAIERIEAAQEQGVSISADQYPWQASGTFLRSAVVPKWVMAGTPEEMLARLEDSQLRSQIVSEIDENVRRRGGPEALLVTASVEPAEVGKNLLELSQEQGKSIAEQVISMVKRSRTRVASFNMNREDIRAFMQQPWVVTSSDGTNGHPRKFASFPRKYQSYVVQEPVISLQDFIHRSTGKTAEYLRLQQRGRLEIGKFADVLVFDPNAFAPKASFEHWDELSTGVQYVLVNGQVVIEQGKFNGTLSGRFVPSGE